MVQGQHRNLCCYTSSLLPEGKIILTIKKLQNLTKKFNLVITYCLTELKQESTRDYHSSWQIEILNWMQPYPTDKKVFSKTSEHSLLYQGPLTTINWILDKLFSLLIYILQTQSAFKKQNGNWPVTYVTLYAHPLDTRMMLSFDTYTLPCPKQRFSVYNLKCSAI